jgi:hypothetical protein
MGAKVLLFGASGKTGRYVAKFALDAGHDVIAFVRDPDKLRSVLVEVGVDPALVDARVTILRGELTDLDSVRSAVRDGGLSRDAGDVIVFCAGKPKSFALVAGAPMLLPAVRAIAETMREVGLKRILIQTGAMSLDGRLRRDPSYRAKRFMTFYMSPLLCIKDMVVDNWALTPYVHTEMMDLEWIVTRPGPLAETRSKNTEKKALGPASSDAFAAYVDVGEWTAKAVFDADLVHTAPILAYVGRK